MENLPPAAVLAGGLAALLLLAAPAGVSAGSHHIEFDSVDGREIRYVDHTRYQSRAGVDLIDFNRYHLDRYSTRVRRHVGVHEAGHALGLGDHDTRRYRGIVMYHAVTGLEKPKAHDRADYTRRWVLGRLLPPPAPGVRFVEGLHAFPPADTSRLVAFADDVFLGTVTAAAGAAPIDTSSPEPEAFVPRTTYRVRVEAAVKGRLRGRVTVAQAGGLDPADGAQLRVNGDPPLQPGTTYLFLTRRDAPRGVHGIVAPGWGDLPAPTEAVRAALLARYRSVVARLSGPSS
ncbi:MAG TPA: hypothetical protein VNO82_04610 [Solirubrobacteraceae bacterium]|nr:hypothetical protein [Solirubrobacteraceae bacterium]